jgi:sn1-specific diacylglycerol lipase
VVIAIRGTLSFYDALTDLTIESEEIEVGDVQEAKAHRGILQAAKYIQMMIDRNGLLVRALAKTPGYRLVITGHSLGAGAAAILSALLRPSYPDLICFSFSPPGWLVSKSLTRYMEEFVCSVIVGKDIVPRMGVLTMNKLKTQIAIAVRNCKRPKYRILFEGLTKVVCDCSVEGDYEILDNSVSESQQADHLLSGPSSRIRNYSEEREPREPQVPHQRQSLVANPFPLYLPGCVLYLDEISPAKGCCGIPLYQPYWSKPEYFSDVLVSTKMLTDHLPNNVYRALSSAAGEHDDIVTFAFNSQIV